MTVASKPARRSDTDRRTSDEIRALLAATLVSLTPVLAAAAAYRTPDAVLAAAPAGD